MVWFLYQFQQMDFSLVSNPQQLDLEPLTFNTENQNPSQHLQKHETSTQ
jgi:hypothetical protein